MSFSRSSNSAKSLLYLKKATVDPVMFALIRILVKIRIHQYINSNIVTSSFVIFPYTEPILKKFKTIQFYSVAGLMVSCLSVPLKSIILCPIKF